MTINEQQYHSICFREDDVAAIDINMGCPKEFSSKVAWVLLF